MAYQNTKSKMQYKALILCTARPPAGMELARLYQKKKEMPTKICLYVINPSTVTVVSTGIIINDLRGTY